MLWQAALYALCEPASAWCSSKCSIWRQAARAGLLGAWRAAAAAGQPVPDAVAGALALVHSYLLAPRLARAGDHEARQCNRDPVSFNWPTDGLPSPFAPSPH